MIKDLVHRLLRHRHFWRDASFDELGEIYVAMLFRHLALGLVGIFVPVFLITSGYGMQGVITFYVAFFVARAIMDIAAGFTVARIGPKHTMLTSYVLQILAAALFSVMTNLSLPVFLPAVFWGAANSFFYLSFHVDFSKVKHSDHGGKELGYVTIMERVGGTIGPVLGGVLATLFGPQQIFLIAIVLLIVSLVPLFRTAEPVKTRQKLNFKDLQLLPIRSDIISYSALSLEQNFCVVLWPVFLTLFVFVNNVYATIGALSSLSILVSVIASYSIGKLIDDKKGGILLRFSAIANALVYCFRPFVKSVGAVLGLNVVNEVLTVGYRLPYFKGLYDAADNQPGHRIVYIVVVEALGSFTKLVFWLLLFVLSTALSDYQLLVAGFLIASAASLIITRQKFQALAYTK